MKTADNKNSIVDLVTRETLAAKYWKKDNFGEGGEGQMEDMGYASVPFVYINNKHIEFSSILRFSIKQKSFVPTVTVEFNDETDYFNSVNSIKSGDMISVVLLSPGDTMKYKPICCDFRVTSIRNLNGTEDQHGGMNSFRVNGTLAVDEIYMHRSYAIKDKTSFEALRQLASDIGVSFASNIDGGEMDDSMTWVNCNDTMDVFIDKITRHAYLDDTSFFISFIDLNYCLNFIEVDRMYTQIAKNEFKDDAVVYLTEWTSKDPNQQKEYEESSSPYKKQSINMITNNESEIGYNYYMSAFNITTNNDPNRTYREYCRYWDLKNKEYIDEFAEGQNHQTPGMIAVNKGQVINDGNWMLENLYSFTNYISIDDSNTHKNYNMAETINRINMTESCNYRADVLLGGNCMNLQRYSCVWVDYYDKAAINIKERNKTGEDEEETKELEAMKSEDDMAKAESRVESDTQKREVEENTQEGTDKTFQLYNVGRSGCYVVNGLEYEYEDGKMRERLTLTRREAAPNTRYYESKTK